MGDDIRIVALSLQILGIYFLALSTIFKKPRRVVEEVIASPRGSLRPVKEYLYRMNQLVIGLILLITGYGLQILGILDDQGEGMPSSSYFFSGWSPIAVMVFLAACISVVGVILHFVGSVLAKRSFKNLIISYVKEHNWAFEDNMKLTKEIGNMIGVRDAAVSTIEEYVVEVKRRLKLLE